MAIIFPKWMEHYLQIGNVLGITVFSIKNETRLWTSALAHLPFYLIYTVINVFAVVSMSNEKNLGVYMRMGLLTMYLEIFVQMIVRFPYYISNRFGFRTVLIKLNEICGTLDKGNCYGINNQKLIITIFTFIAAYSALRWYQRENVLSNMVANTICVAISLYDELIIYLVLNEISEQYKFINDKINCDSFFINLDNVIPVSSKPRNEQDNMKKLKGSEKNDFLNNVFVLSETHLRLSKVVKTVNQIFGVPTLINVSMAFTVITLATHSISTDIRKFNGFDNIFFNLLEIVLVLARLTIAVNKFCQVSAQSKRTVICLHKIWNCMAHHNEIDIKAKHLKLLIVQLDNVNPQFTAHGSFDVDWPVILMIVGAASTYVVILLQFEIAAGSI